MQSLGSFDVEDKNGVYERHTKMQGNDIAQVHRYLDLGARLEVCHGPVDVLAADAVRTLLAWHPGKPVILAESGAVEPRHSGPFKLYAKDKEGTILHDVLFAPFFAGAAGPGQIWHWDQYVDANNLWWHFDRFAEAVNGIDPVTERFEPSMIAHERLRVYVLRGALTALIWIRDTKNDWRSELERGEEPEALRGLTVKWGGPARVEFYDPWTQKTSAGTAAGGELRLPEFRRSLVVKMRAG
jgi:hypothetical protein